MPMIPAITRLKAQTPQILNAIRNDLGGTYQDLIPLANNTSQSIKAIGQVIMSNNLLQNSFLTALINKVGLSIVTSKSYSNPWKMFKKGQLEFGETIEEIFVSMAKSYQYDPDDAETTLYKKYLPDVNAAFHTMNFAKFYPVTVKREELQQAFLSLSGVTDLITRITESLYTGMEYDEFIVMKYMLARIMLNGKITPVTIPAITKANVLDIVEQIKTISGNFTYMRSDFNMAGVKTLSPKEDQYLIMTTGFEAKNDVNVLASAFNMEKVEFTGHRVGVDGFDIVDTERLAELFADDPSYVPFTEAELAELKSLPAILVDKDFFMIFDNLQELTEAQNGKGLYWNYFLHAWKTFSVSPFANAALFTTLTPAITSVTVSPATATGSKGMKLMLSAAVVATGFANDSVIWSVNSDHSVVTPDGQLTISKAETLSELTITATSVFDATKKDTCVLTIV